MNRPILIVVIGYIIGIIWGIYLKISILPFYFFLFVIYIIIKLPYKKRKFNILSIKRYFRYIKLIFKINIIITIIISSFISNTIIKILENKYENLYHNSEELRVSAIVIGNRQEKDYYDRYKVKVTDRKYRNTNLYINVSKKKKLEYGDKITFCGEFKEPSRARNYKGFNYKQYLKTLKIYGTVKTEKIEILEKNKSNPIMQISNKVLLRIKNKIEKTYSNEMSKIILGIMLGDTTEIDDDTKEDFANSNISHVLAVSGLHISYIILLVTKSTKNIFGKKESKIIASITLAVYMSITGFSISVVRASIMGILTCMAFVVYRKSDTLNNIAISALIILISNPYNLISISFLLTYGGTLGIIYFQPIVEKIIKSFKIKNRRWKYAYLRIQRKCENIISIISVSISAQIIIAPIMALYFNSAGLGFLITNLLLSYLIGIIVIGGFIQILISLISIKVGIALAKIIEIPLHGIIIISKINIANFKVITPDIYQVILYYFTVCILAYLYKIFNQRHCNITQERIKNTLYLLRYKSRPYFKIIRIIIIILVIVFYSINKIPDNLKIYFIDVGQEDSTLIITPRNKKVLIDGGGSGSYDVGKNILLPYLLNRKIKKIDYMVISHFDNDHIRTDCYIFYKKLK